MRQKVLLHGDVDAIKDFVFETSSLPQIRGGSQLLLDCEKAVKQKINALGGRTIYCAGGTFLFEILADQALTAKKEIERIYLERTLLATVTVVYEEKPLPSTSGPAPDDGWAGRLCKAHEHSRQAGEFARRVAFLAAALREAKTRKREAPFLEAFPFGKRCEACGRRVAQEEVLRYKPEEPEERPEPVSLCQVCLLRHQKGIKAKGRFNEKFERFASPKARRPRDLEHLVRSARRNHIAFLYADGNDIGKLLQMVRSEEEYKVLSEALEKGTEEALYEALQSVCGRALRNPQGYWPFEIINIGGDDVTLFIQAGYAWEVAVEFLERFEAKVKGRIEEKLGHWPQGWPERITASCGIAIADVKYPVRYLERLAAGLLKEAKREAKADPDKPRSAVTFLWLPTPVAAEKAEPLMTQYYQECGGTQLLLTARPYELERARRMLELTQQAAQWPRTLRHRWAEALERGRWLSLNLLFYDIARRKEEEREQWLRLLNEVGALARELPTPASVPAPLWQRYQRGETAYWRTALLDLLELAELYAMRPEVREQEERQ